MTPLLLFFRLVSHAVRDAYTRGVGILDARVFPAIVMYATHPYVILCTILLLAPLILDHNDTTLQLLLGNYTNVVSASVSSIVLMQSLKHHAENKRLHAKHAEEIKALHAKIDAQQQQP